MTTWFTADTHFGHLKIIDYCQRPWDTVEAMNEGLVEHWNSVVKPDDFVWHLGDLALNPKKAASWIVRLNGKKLLIPGNHDECFRSRSKCGKWALWYQEYLGFGVIIDDTAIDWKLLTQLDHPKVVFSHFPYISHVNRDFSEYAPKDTGKWLLHGHVHKAWAENGKQINVGIDVRHYKPISLEEVMQIIQGGKACTLS